MAFFLRFFGRLEDDTVLRLPINRIAPNLVSWAFAGHSTRNERCKRQNIIISRMPLFWRLFGAFSAVSKTTLSCAYLFTELHQTWFLGLLQAILPETNVGNGQTLLLPDCHGFGAFLALFWHFFGAFSAVSKTTLYCAYPLTELHQTRFLGLLQAKSPESSIGNGKTLILADCHGFRVFLALFRPSRRQRCPALTPGPNCTKLGFLGFCRPFHRNRPLETGKHHYEQIATVLAFFWHFFSRLEDDAVLRLPID